MIEFGKNIIGKNLLRNFSTSRSNLTCNFKCGNACATDAPNEFSPNQYFGDVVRQSRAGQRTFTRRAALKVGGASAVTFGAGMALAACSSDDTHAQSGAMSTANTGEPDVIDQSSASPVEGMRFQPVQPNTDDVVTIPEGYQQNVLIRWGDPIHQGGPEFNFDQQSADAQKVQFGFNNDFAGVTRGDDGKALYVASHEYTTEPMMFHDWSLEDVTKEQVDIGLAAHGHTILACDEAGDGFLTPDLSDSRNRRITGFTKFRVTGPAAGHKKLQTAADPTGTEVEGTLNNCSGGMTPWGTMLSGEENVDQYFGGIDEIDDEELKAEYHRYSIKKNESQRGWEKFYDRFDLTKEPNEPNRFFWVVEIDPHDPDSTPVKHTALGRFKHEAGQIHVADDGTVVCYMGDDERFEYIYKFVSSKQMRGISPEEANRFTRGSVQGSAAHAALSAEDRAHNMQILEEGTLYVAQFAGNSPKDQIDGSGELPEDGTFDGTINWIPLMTATADGNHQSHVDGMDAAEVCIFTRQAADQVGATRMDRPEDVEASPVTGKVYAALTNNKYRGKAGSPDAGTDGAGRDYEDATEVAPVSENKNGLVLEMDDDHAGTTGTWNLLLVCGDPKEAYTYFGGFDKEDVSPISCPDNLAFDEYGNLWISTDGNALGGNDGLYAVAVAGERRGETKCFLTVPTGAETCGPVIEDSRVFVSVQHPGEDDDATTADPLSHWPEGGSAQPRPAVVQVVRTDGGRIGV